MAVVKSPAIVLRHRDYRDSDRVVTLFTRDCGRISGLARGVRKSVKRFAGRLDLFVHIEIQYREGKGELVNLEGSTLYAANLGIREDLYKIAWAAFYAELVEKLFAPHEVHTAAFEILREAYAYLAPADSLSEGVLRAYELKLLTEAGMLPEVEACVSCRAPVDSDRRFSFVVTRGGVMCESCAPIESGLLVSSTELLKLARAGMLPCGELPSLEFNPHELKSIRNLMTSFLRYHVHANLKSAAFLASLIHESDE